jgi:hypothetical protein
MTTMFPDTYQDRLADESYLIELLDAAERLEARIHRAERNNADPAKISADKAELLMTRWDIEKLEASGVGACW